MDNAYDSMHAMWSRLFWPAGALVMVSVAALLFRHALFVAVRRWSGHRTTEDSVFLQAIRVPSLLWCIVLGLFVAIEMAELPPRLAAPIHAVLEAAIILSVTLTVAGVLGSLVAAAGERRALAVGVTGLFRTSVRLTVLSVGDYVRLSAESVEGYVVDVGWRSTRIRMLQNNVVVVPNKRVAESIITNYDLGETRMALLIRV